MYNYNDMKSQGDKTPAKSEQIERLPVGFIAKESDLSMLGELLPGILDHYHQALIGPSRRGLDYLKASGLSDMAMLVHFRVGYVDGTLKTKLSAAQVKQMQQMGLLNAKEEETFTNRVIVPVLNDSGIPVGLCGEINTIARVFGVIWAARCSKSIDQS